MTRITQISKEELEPIISAREKALEVAQTADKALKDARLAELEFKVQIQQLYLAKGLDANCKVDISNGSVAWPDETQETSAPAVVEVADVKTEKSDGPSSYAALRPTSKRRGKRPVTPGTDE